MSNIFDIIDKYKYGIVAACAVAVGIFMYLELTYVEQYFEIESSFDKPTIELKKEEELIVTPENLQIEPPPQYAAGKVTNTARDMSDTRQRSDENWSASKSAGDVEKSVRDEERKMFDDTGGEAKRKAIREQDEARKKNQKETIKEIGKTKGDGPGSSSVNAVDGDVMVDWKLANRNPHLNDSWHVRNPGYTCGRGSSGRVAITIKVGQDGKVITAVLDPSGTSSANSCMIEQALKYAKLSRFDYSGSAPESQTGKIYYTFVSQ